MRERQLQSEYDVAVIGAGMGGLTAAAAVAKFGLSVFVADMNPSPGGCISGFSRNGFHFESAIHWLNLFGRKGPARKLLSFFSPDVPQTPAPRAVRRFKGESFDYTLTSNPDELRDTLIRDFPKDEKGIVRFFAAAKDMGEAFHQLTGMMRAAATMSISERARFLARTTSAGLSLMKYSKWKTEEGLRKFFPTSKAGQIFCSETRLSSCLVPIGWIYTDNYHLPPKGGSRTLADWLSNVVTSMDGHVRLKTKVIKIIVENGAATGMVCRDLPSGQEYLVRCRHIIAACDTESLYSVLLPKGSVGTRVIDKIRGADIYDSAVTVSLGLSRPATDFGIGEELVYLTKDSVERRLQDGGDPDKARITLMSSSSADPSLAPPGKGTLSIYLPARLSQFDHWKTGPQLERGAAYRDHKKQYADIILKRIENALIPGLMDAVEFCDVATPLTYLRYTGNREGSIMGTRMSFRNWMNGVSGYRSPFPNIYIGGQWAEWSGGVPTAIRAGANSAMLVLKRESKSAFEAAEEMFEV
jgi:phytoene dehydrogenase-like protein